MGDVAVIRLDDGKANALGFEIVDGLLGALDDAANAKAVCIIGRDGRFSAGFDLKVMRSDRMLELMTKGSGLALRLVAHPTPVVLGVTGPRPGHGRGAAPDRRLAGGRRRRLQAGPQRGPDRPVRAPVRRQTWPPTGCHLAT